MTARILGVVAEGGEEALRLAARTFDDVEIEAVVRFGAPRRELDAFAPSLVAFFGARATGLLARWRAWRLPSGDAPHRASRDRAGDGAAVAGDALARPGDRAPVARCRRGARAALRAAVARGHRVARAVTT